MLLNVKEANKVSAAHIPIPVSQRIEAYHADEMRNIWISDISRNWEIYSRRVMEDSF